MLKSNNMVLDTHHTRHRLIVVILMCLELSRSKMLWCSLGGVSVCKTQSLSLTGSVLLYRGLILLTATTYMYFAIFKDKLWCLDFVLLSSVSHDGLGLCHSSLGEQPSWRLWDEPASAFNRHRCSGLKMSQDINIFFCTESYLPPDYEVRQAKHCQNQQ